MLSSLGEWILDTTANLTDDQFQQMLYSEHGGLNEVFADMAAIFNDPRYLKLGQQFTHQKIIQPLIVNHGNLSVLGFRINDFTYITDMHSISDAEKDKIHGSKILVLNALRKEPHNSHLHLEAAINFANEIGAEKTFFTHISHRLGFHEKVNKELPDGMFLAYDNLILSI